MKKYIFLFVIIAFAFTQFSCSSNDDNYDDNLIEAIQLATKQSVDAAALPTDAQGILALDFTESHIDKTLHAIDLGYEVTVRRKEGSDIGEKSEVYFSENGKELRKKKDGKRKKGEHGCDKEECFEVVFPITMIMPDGITVTGNKEELGEGIDEWYKVNEESKEKPTYQYPIQIIYDDGSTSEVNSDTEFKEAYLECK